MEFQKIEYQQINDVLMAFRRAVHVLYSNTYSLPDDFLYYYIKSDKSLVFKQSNSDFVRLYFLSSDIDDLSMIIKAIKDDVIVYNVPVREELGVYAELATKVDYSQYSLYKRFYNKNIDKGVKVLKMLTEISGDGTQDKIITSPAIIEDAKKIEELLLNTFDKYTDYIPSKSKIESYISNGNVLVNKTTDGEITGAVIFIITGVKCYENFWVDNSGHGFELMSRLYQLMQAKGIKVTNLWIADWNVDVVKMHKMFGALPDGMSDYTFINQNIK